MFCVILILFYLFAISLTKCSFISNIGHNLLTALNDWLSVIDIGYPYRLENSYRCFPILNNKNQILPTLNLNWITHKESVKIVDMIASILQKLQDCSKIVNDVIVDKTSISILLIKPL